MQLITVQKKLQTAEPLPYILFITQRVTKNLITWYESDHSDITVQYIWGVDDQNGISEKDAISSLNTQLLAGEGPDVIIMDGLNVKKL